MVRSEESVILRELVVNVVRDGKRYNGEKILYSVLKELKRRNRGLKPVSCLYESVVGISPVLRLKKKKKSGGVYRFPVPITDRRGRGVGVKWLFESGGEVSGDLVSKICNLIQESNQGYGVVVDKGESLYKQAKEMGVYLNFR